MAGFTLFPAETGVKLTLQRRAAMIAPMRSRVSHMAICAAVALACNEGLQPTTAAPAIRGTVTYQGHLPDSLRDSTGAVLVMAFATFPQTPADLLHFAAVAFLDTGGPPRRYELRDRKSTRLNSSHGYISYAVFCLKKKKQQLSDVDVRLS